MRHLLNQVLHDKHLKDLQYTEDLRHEPTFSSRRFTVPGTRVICIETDLETNIHNGLRGVISTHLNKDNTVKVETSDGRCIKFEKKNWSLAYSITANKAQGSESNVPFIYGTKHDFHMRSDWVYTAISRGKLGVKYLMSTEQHEAVVQKQPLNPPSMMFTLMRMKRRHKKHKFENV